MTEVVHYVAASLGGCIAGPRENVRLPQSRLYPNGVAQLRYARSPDL